MKKENPNYYAVIPADVRYSDITPNAKLLYGEITALCNKEGYCWSSNNYFAELYNVSTTSVSKWIRELKEHNFIHYEILEYNHRKIFIGGIKKSSKGYEEKFKGGIKKSSKGVLRKVQHNNTKNNTSNKKESNKEKNNNSPSLNSDQSINENKVTVSSSMFDIHPLPDDTISETSLLPEMTQYTDTSPKASQNEQEIANNTIPTTEQVETKLYELIPATKSSSLVPKIIQSILKRKDEAIMYLEFVAEDRPELWEDLFGWDVIFYRDMITGFRMKAPKKTTKEENQMLYISKIKKYDGTFGYNSTVARQILEFLDLMPYKEAVTYINYLGDKSSGAFSDIKRFTEWDYSKFKNSDTSIYQEEDYREYV